MLSEFLPVTYPDNIKVINRPAPAWLKRKNQGIDGGEQLLVCLGPLPARAVPFRQVAQFDAENSSLNRVQPAIVTFYVVVVPLGLTVVAQLPDFLCQFRIVSRNRPGFPTGA